MTVSCFQMPLWYQFVQICIEILKYFLQTGSITKADIIRIYIKLFGYHIH